MPWKRKVLPPKNLFGVRKRGVVDSLEICFHVAFKGPGKTPDVTTSRNKRCRGAPKSHAFGRICGDFQEVRAVLSALKGHRGERG